MTAMDRHKGRQDDRQIQPRKRWSPAELRALRQWIAESTGNPMSQLCLAVEIGASERAVRGWEANDRTRIRSFSLDALDEYSAKVGFTEARLEVEGEAQPSPQCDVDARLERQVAMAAKRALRFAVIAEGGSVSFETLESLGDEVQRIARIYPQQPLPVFLGDLVEVQSLIFGLLESRPQPRQLLDLYFLAGVATGMMAKASHDLGDAKAAMIQARTGYACAQNAGHGGLSAWMRGMQSLIAYWAGQPNEAQRYAELGVDIAASQSNGTLSAWLPALAARAWASLGNAEMTTITVARATAARDVIAPDDLDGIGGIMTFPLPRQLYYIADASVLIRENEREAELQASAALEAYATADKTDRSFSDEAGAACDLALARVRQREVEGASDALQTVLDLPPGQRIGGIIPSMRRIHAALTEPTLNLSPSVQDLQEEIELFCRTPAAALPH